MPNPERNSRFIILFSLSTLASFLLGCILRANLLLLSGLLNYDDNDEPYTIDEFCSRLPDYKLSYFDSLYVRIFEKFSVRAKYNNSTVFVKSITTTEFNDVENNLRKLSNSDLYIRVLKAISNKTTEKLLLCPSPVNLPKLIGDDFGLDNLFTAIETNPESFVLQPPEWPVPKFFGSCGRLDIVEDCGVMLTKFYSAPWQIRVELSIQLINAAYTFTFQHPEYGFYLTDPSPDNIAVKQKELKFIDLGSIIIVDKHPINEDPEFDSPSSYKYEACHNCYRIDPELICSSRISDFNFLQICQVILGDKSLIFLGGLLHHSPNQNITDLIHECVIGRLDRFATSQKLLNLLRLEIQ